MPEIQVTYLSKASHNSQILTGFHCLGADYSVSITGQAVPGPALVQADYLGKCLIYDTNDGYFDVTHMTQLLKKCDFYFQRSFCPEKNRKHFGELAQKIFPLGLNYHVSYRGNPLDKVCGLSRSLTAPKYMPKMFEGTPNVSKSDLRILFYTRLWSRDSMLPEPVNQERDQLNEMRIDILRTLKAKYGKHFDGGVEDSPLARQICPELILPKRKTRRYAYIKRLHSSDICIASMGLHGSVGWKTGEYVAAAKAIVCEKFACELPGEFGEGTHYLSFSSAGECLQAVEKLVQDSQLRQQLQENNFRYYHSWLKPEALIRNTLRIVERAPLKTHF